MLNLLTPKVALYITAVVALGLAIVYVRGLQDDSKQLDVVRGQYSYYVKRNEVLNKTSAELNIKINSLQKQKEALNKELNDERRNPVYHTCVVPANGVSLLNRAISGVSK